MHRSAQSLILVLVLSACTGQVTGEETVSSTSGIALVGAGERLLLDGTPVDARYRAAYPNPEGITRMDVRILDGGEVDVQCDRACTESPFFTELEALPSGMLRVRLWDVYGALVAEEDVQSTEMALRAAPDDGGDEFTPADVPDTGDGGGDGGLDCPRPEAKQRFCDAVNEGLASYGLSEHAIDCATIGDSFSFAFPTDVDFTRETPLDRCNDVLRPAEDVIEAGFDAADDWCGELQLEAWVQNTRTQLISDGVCQSSPLILDLEDDGITLSSLDDGTTFDLLANGRPVQTAWPASGDAFLARDIDGNGRIDGSAELFGNVTAGKRYDDGFRALAALDTRRDGRIDARDRAFTSLVLWRDVNRDGASSPSELTPLRAAGIRALSVRPRQVTGMAATDAHGNGIPLVAWFERTDGTRGTMVDAWLRYRPLSGAVASR